MTINRIPSLVMAATALLAVLACKDNSVPNDTPRPTATASSINRLDRDRVRDGGRLTLPLSQLPTNFNLNELDGTLLDTAFVMFAMMPTTFRYDATGTPMWDRDYLESEPRLTTSPRQVVTYNINSRAVWDDGTPLTWEDFFWQWKASNGSDASYRIAGSVRYQDIESVTRGNTDREVVVTFKRKFTDWPSLFNQFYPASTNKHPGVFNDGWKDRPRASAGPFRFASLDRTAQTITLVRNDNWWGERAKLDEIVFRVIEADAQIDALANSEIDAMDVADANRYARAQGISSVEVRAATGPNFAQVTLNGSRPFLTDERVRRAVAMGIDRSVIAKSILAPIGVNSTPLNNHLFMPNQHGYRDNSAGVGIFDLGAASQLLDAAGWTLDGTLRKKDGRPLELTCVLQSGIGAFKQVAEVMQHSLRQLGIALRIAAVPGQDFFDKYITPGQFDLTLFVWYGGPYPISPSRAIYGKPTMNAKGGLEINQNYARVGSNEIDRLYDQAAEEFDRDGAAAIGNRIDSLIWQSVHSLPLYQHPELIAVKKTLANFGAFGFVSPWAYQNIGWAEP